jgi:hypothetical protein
MLSAHLLQRDIAVRIACWIDWLVRYTVASISFWVYLFTPKLVYSPNVVAVTASHCIKAKPLHNHCPLTVQASPTGGPEFGTTVVEACGTGTAGTDTVATTGVEGIGFADGGGPFPGGHHIGPVLAGVQSSPVAGCQI